MTRLESLCDAVQRHEGWWPMSHSWRYNNPGNLRWSKFQAGQKNGFAFFSSYASGWLALYWDLYVKCSGKSTTGLASTSTLADLFRVWAPVTDGNDPNAYAFDVAQRLGVPVSTPLAWFLLDIQP